MDKKSFRKAKAIISKCCSVMLGYNSVREILLTKTPDALVRTAIEAVVSEKAEGIGRDYLAKPEILQTIKITQVCDNVMEYMFSIFNNGTKENYVVCLCSSKPRLATYQPVDKLIINL